MTNPRRHSKSLLALSRFCLLATVAIARAYPMLTPHEPPLGLHLLTTHSPPPLDFPKDAAALDSASGPSPSSAHMGQTSAPARLGPESEAAKPSNPDPGSIRRELMNKRKRESRQRKHARWATEAPTEEGKSKGYGSRLEEFFARERERDRIRNHIKRHPEAGPANLEQVLHKGRRRMLPIDLNDPLPSKGDVARAVKLERDRNGFARRTAARRQQEQLQTDSTLSVPSEPVGTSNQPPEHSRT